MFPNKRMVQFLKSSHILTDNKLNYVDTCYTIATVILFIIMQTRFAFEKKLSTSSFL